MPTIYLDFEKAYDAVPANSILLKGLYIGLSKHTVLWLKAFLHQRTFQVKVNDCLSKVYSQERGIPQGSVISPSLFNIFVHDLPKQMKHSKISQFADDVAIWKSSRNVKFACRQLNLDLNNIVSWCKTWGAKLSSRKTKAMIFTHRQYNTPKLKLESTDIEIVQNLTFLGLIFDSRLSWKPHIDNINTRCNKRLNVLKCIVGSDWGSDTASLLLLFRALIRPIIDYGCEVYDSAKATVKRKLDTIQLNALKICTGTTYFTSLASLQVECGEMPLEIRREMISSKHRTKLECLPLNHPIREPISTCWQYDLIDFKDERPFIHRTFHPPGKLEYNNPLHVEVPPWRKPAPVVEMDLHYEIEKKNTPPPVMYALSMNKIHEKWGNHVHIYTDGSKDQNNNTSSAVYIPKYNTKIAKKISPISIFRAEQVAIIMALEWIRESKLVKSVIFCDSLSVLCDLQELNQSRLSNEIRHLLYVLKKQHLEVFFEWIPSHCGIFGNEIVDGLAKDALEQENETEIAHNKSEINNIISNHYMEMWQQAWVSSQRGRFLFHLQPTIRPTFKSNLLCRRDENIMHRLRVGSCLLNETLFKLKKHVNGKCFHCNAPETVQHFLLDCRSHNEYRSELQKNLRVDRLSIKNILNNREQHHVILFVKQTGKYKII